MENSSTLKAIPETIREQADFALNNFKNQKSSIRCGGNAKLLGVMLKSI